MLNDFILTDKQLKTPLYQQIYQSVREAIESGSLKKGSKLPSIRSLSEDRGISKTTVIGAYEQLCVEGYIVSEPQRGYFVAAEFGALPQAAAKTDNTRGERRYYEYDFSGNSIDARVIDIGEWKKCIKDVINRDYLLTSYGDAQGEEALRNALQHYALGTRGVNAQADNIVVGAGTQAVLLLLCSLIGAHKTVAVERARYLQAEIVFRSFDWHIVYFDCDRNGVRIDSLQHIQPDVVMINPNCTGTRGGSMPVTRRLELIAWARENSALILEDDYNGELRYSTRPIPCVQNHDTENTVYIGSFSKVLLPSVRLSYSVLPQSLLEIYQGRKHLMNQTASKTEQLALAKYIESRKIEAHLRRARRVYLEKSKYLMRCVARYFPNAATDFNETALYLDIHPPIPFSRDKLDKALAERSLRLTANNENAHLLRLSFSGIAQEKIDEGVHQLAEAYHILIS